MALITDFGGQPYSVNTDASAAAQACLDADGILELPASAKDPLGNPVPNEWGLHDLVLPINFQVCAKTATIWSEGTQFCEIVPGGTSRGLFDIGRLWLGPSNVRGIRINDDFNNVEFDIREFNNRSVGAPGIELDGGRLFYADIKGQAWRQHRDATVPFISMTGAGQVVSTVTHNIAQMECSIAAPFAEYACTTGGNFFYMISVIDGGFQKPDAGAFYFSGCSDVHIVRCHSFDMEGAVADTWRFTNDAGGNGCVGGSFAYRRSTPRDWKFHDAYFQPNEAFDFDIYGVSGHNTSTAPQIRLEFANGHSFRSGNSTRNTHDSIING